MLILATALFQINEAYNLITISVQSCFRSLEFIALPLRFRAEVTEKRRKMLWIQNDGTTVARYCTFIRTIGSVYRWVRHGRTIDHRSSFEKSAEFREPLPSRSVSPVHAAYRAWEIEWRAQITFLYISGDTARKHRRDERKRARDSHAFATHDSLKETMLMLCARVVHARDRHVSAKTGQASLRNVLVSDITRTINNCICELSILPLQHIASVPEHFARARSAMCKSCIKHGLHVYVRARLSAKL